MKPVKGSQHCSITHKQVVCNLYLTGKVVPWVSEDWELLHEAYFGRIKRKEIDITGCCFVCVFVWVFARSLCSHFLGSAHLFVFLNLLFLVVFMASSMACSSAL